MNIRSEFENFYTKHLGKNSMDIHNVGLHIESSMTPYILEERELRATQIDIFSRLMRDRLLWVSGPVDDRMSTVVQAQLMFLDSIDKTDITMHIDSPGGSVKSGLSMVDVMQYIECDIKCPDIHIPLLGEKKDGKLIFDLKDKNNCVYSSLKNKIQIFCVPTC